MNPYQEAVETFHQATGSTIGETPELRDTELRAKLILEEAVETAAAMGFRASGYLFDPNTGLPLFSTNKLYEEPVFPDAIDGLVDLVYVTLGAAVAWGIDLDPFFEEVQRANMSKASGPRRGDGKVLKPEGWKPPDIEAVLDLVRLYTKAQG